MNFLISKIFDATESKDYRPFGSMKCENPFTFYVNFGGFKVFPNTFGFSCGFRTQEEALEYSRQVRVMLLGKQVFYALVTKNSDFIEGKGQMLAYKLFWNPGNAHDYVMSKRGIYGSSQYFNIHFGVNVNGGLYVVTSYNGYDIKLMKAKEGVEYESTGLYERSS